MQYRTPTLSALFVALAGCAALPGGGEVYEPVAMEEPVFEEAMEPPSPEGDGVGGLAPPPPVGEPELAEEAAPAPAPSAGVVLDEMASERRRAPRSAAAASARDDLTYVDVLYATQRTLKERGRGGPLRYTADPATALSYGVAEVSLPPNHQCARLEGRDILRGDFTLDEDDDVVLQGFTVLGETDFYARLVADVAATPQRHVLVFIHGFSVGFDDAARRTAQLQYDLANCFEAPLAAPVMYSWPARSGLFSSVSVFDYLHDRETSEGTVSYLTAFLNDVADRSGADKIHVIAHSMGNNALVRALVRIAEADRARERPVFGQIVLAAADIERSIFLDMAARMRGVGEQVTLYASSNDRAMQAARRLRGDLARAGDATPPILIADGVATVDASSVQTDLFGVNHSFFGDEASILSDLAAMFWTGAGPADRGLAEAGGGYWVLNP